MYHTSTLSLPALFYSALWCCLQTRKSPHMDCHKFVLLGWNAVTGVAIDLIIDSTQHCGEPVLSFRVEERCVTVFVGLKRKFQSSNLLSMV